MKYVDEYRDPAAARRLVARIADLAGDDHFKFMEVCGGHTHTIYRHGIEHVLPESVELVHGPGCPVCVIPMGRVDDAIAIAETPGVIFTSFGDMMRVPGSRGNLLGAKARGADVRFVYSPLDALQIAVENPERAVVFFAVGFETTAPSTAVTLLHARENDVANFHVFSNHVTIVPPIKAILESPDLRLDGFLGPGHVSTVVGNRPYRFVPEKYGKPLVTAGFEPLDILQAIVMLLMQIREGRCEVENQYARVVRDGGNPRALQILAEVFELRPHFEWRGLGFISQSALRLRPEFAKWDAELHYSVPGVRVADPKACQCGEVLKGVIKPWECKVFGTACTPETPIGTCMVSSEGACAAYYNFGRLHREGCRDPGACPRRLTSVEYGNCTVMSVQHATPSIQNPVGRIAADHPGVVKIGRAGWFAKGVVYTIAGFLALSVAAKASGWADPTSSTGDQEASPVSAIKTVAGSSGGTLLLWLLAAGMLLYAAWRVVSALLPGSTDAKGWAHRIGYIASAVMYTTFAISAIALARHAPENPDGNKRVTDISEKIMTNSAGRVLIGLVGLIVIAVGIYRVSKGATMDVDDELDMSGMSATRRTWTERLGAVGEVGRGIGFALVGFFLVRSAITYNVNEATGLDGALRRLAVESWGVIVVVVVGIGFAAYGLFCLATFTRRRLQAP